MKTHIALWLITAVTFFLSLWIVLPAPTLFWLPLGVGAPEISPLLAIVSIILFVLTLWHQHQLKITLLLVIILLSAVLSSLPLLKLPTYVAQAERSMATVFAVSGPAAASTPFSWRRFFRGITFGNVRSQTGIPFSEPDGVPLSLDLYQPEVTGQYPAVVTIYGGGWQDGNPASSEKMGRFLAARGYVVAAIDYRHAPEYRFPAQLDDVQAALDFVRDRADEYEIKKEAIALLGWSAGAHLALLAGFQAPTDIRSIVDYYGPVDLTTGYREPPSPDPLNVRQVLTAFIGGTPDELPQLYKQASPITYASAAKADTLPPSLLIYGGRDHIVEARFGKQLHSTLRKSGNAAVWLHIPWAEHAFDKVFNGVSNQLALHFIERFLEQTLQR